MKSPALALLDKLISNTLADSSADPSAPEPILKSRKARHLELLRHPLEPDPSWFMHLPPCFNSALDIRLTVRAASAQPVYTQGANFSFAVGDAIYDSPLAYLPWDRALASIRFCFKIRQASPVSPPSAAAPRHPGRLQFDVCIPNPDRSALATAHTLTATQDQFVHFLVAGLPLLNT